VPLSMIDLGKDSSTLLSSGIENRVMFRPGVSK
jgi:hypothetical protein